ncbi:MAG: RluA family pseudouridine synthase [Lewinellaceae bacterium]|nr:RluA family pseudouridine synthase [Lewinellaceae bacterium]
MNLTVIYEDNHLIAVNKPAGVLVQGDDTGDTTLADMVKEYIKHRYQKPGDVFLGTVHRLDRPVSGVVVFARTSKALSRMNELFRERQIEKTYWAIVDDRPDPLVGTLVHYIDKDTNRNIAKALDQPSNRHKDAKRSELTYEMIVDLEGKYLLKVNPLTGRPHQIRVQLAKVGLPIIGDLKYGHPQALSDASIGLHCRSLAFIHPVKKEPVLITADAPDTRWWRPMEAVLME